MYRIDIAIYFIIIENLLKKKKIHIEDFSLSNLQKYTEYQCLFV